MTYRAPKLLDAAKDAPRCFGCGKHNDGSIVAAHSNQGRDGKGMGMKAADYRVAFLCSDCHSAIDQGLSMARQERIEFWEEAHRKSIGWLFESGRVKAV